MWIIAAVGQGPLLNNDQYLGEVASIYSQQSAGAREKNKFFQAPQINRTMGIKKIHDSYSLYTALKCFNEAT